MNWNQFIIEISSNYIQEFLYWPEAHTRLLVYLLLHLTTGFEHSPAQVTRRIWKAEGKLRNELLMNRSSEKRKWKRVQKEIHSLWKLHLMMVWAFFPPRSEWLPHHSPSVFFNHGTCHHLVQLTCEQHRFELRRSESTYTWIFFFFQ